MGCYPPQRCLDPVRVALIVALNIALVVVVVAYVVLLVDPQLKEGSCSLQLVVVVGMILAGW